MKIASVFILVILIITPVVSYAYDDEEGDILKVMKANSEDKIWDSIYEGMSEANKIKFGHIYGEKLLKAAGQGDLHTIKEIMSLPVETGGLLMLRLIAKDKDGNTALHLAVAQGHGEIVEYLLSQGLRGFDVKNNAGETPIDLAKENGHEEISKLMLSYEKK